jgi:hypothetical protein
MTLLLRLLGLPSFALYVAFPRPDYYEGSAPPQSDPSPYESALRQFCGGSPVAS